VEPDIQYARAGDVAIAYQVVGDGPVDLVYVPLNLSVAVCWEFPAVASFFERLASFSRLILFDKRGTGISDRPMVWPTLEAQMDDVRAVLDAVGSEQAALFGAVQGAQVCALFAATYPERCSRLILYNALARWTGSQDERRAFLRRVRENWGTGETIETLSRANYPSLADDPAFQRWFAKAVRISASPGSQVAFSRTFLEGDITDVLPAIRVPTLVLYRRDLEPRPPGLFSWDLESEARRIAAAIPDARVVPIPGRDFAPSIGSEIPDEVERFIRAQSAPVVPDRVLTTVLFTDIVGSTERAAELGDRRWRDLLTAHRLTVRRELARFRGEEVDTAGDGFLATFDGPARAIECARSIFAAEDRLQLRAGLHTGECELADGKVSGLAVHIGARVVGNARPGEILVSGTVKDLVAGSELRFDDRGAHRLKGVPGEWQLYGLAPSA
jgi:class 3 adenylate cyclase/pimeloyl-ACP methyl ester carboxylesterase